MKTVSKRLLSLTAFLLSVSLFAVSAEAAGSPQTSVSNSGEEFDAHQNQPVQTTQTSPAYEGTGLTKRQLAQNSKADIKSLKPSSIIGTDERIRISPTTSFPYRATAQLTVTYSGSTSTYGCTGFLSMPTRSLRRDIACMTRKTAGHRKLRQLPAATDHCTRTALIQARHSTVSKGGQKTVTQTTTTAQSK